MGGKKGNGGKAERMRGGSDSPIPPSSVTPLEIYLQRGRTRGLTRCASACAASASPEPSHEGATGLPNGVYFSTIASTGQTSEQLPHSVHFSSLIT
jgi:hypothetical protein